MYYESMQELIGHTPMVRLNHIRMPEGARLFAKLELWNPAGSVKDRIGRSMLDDAERTGRLRPGGAIIEATAGNTGLGVAFAALNRGYRVIFVVPEKFSEEKQTLMRALGAEIVNAPREGGILGAAAASRSSLSIWSQCSPSASPSSSRSTASAASSASAPSKRIRRSTGSGASSAGSMN